MVQDLEKLIAAQVKTISHYYDVRLEVFTEMKNPSVVFWVVMPCNDMIQIHQHVHKNPKCIAS
jgi:hypothetical protein